MGLPRVPSNMRGGWPLIAFMSGARLNQVGECMLAIMAAQVDRYEHQEEGMTLVLKAQEFFFSTINNIHLTPISVKSQVVLDLVSPITLWIL